MVDKIIEHFMEHGREYVYWSGAIAMCWAIVIDSALLAVIGFVVIMGVAVTA